MSTHLFRQSSWLCLLFFSIAWGQAIGQVKYWRVGIVQQTGQSFGSISETSTFGTFATNQEDFAVKPTRALMFVAERNINTWLRLNAGLGRSRQTFSNSSLIAYPVVIPGMFPRDEIADVEQNQRQTVFALGLTATRKLFGPFLLAAGFDVLTRYNRQSEPAPLLQETQRLTIVLKPDVLDRDPSTWVDGIDVRSLTSQRNYRELAVSPVTMAVSPRLGLEALILDRLSLSVAGIATLGLGKLLDGRGDISILKERTQVQFSHSGSFWGVQVGAKYHLWRGRARKGLHF